MPTITVAAAAAIAKRHPTVIKRALARGDIKGQRITPRMWLVDEASLREWMKKPRRAGRPKAQ